MKIWLPFKKAPAAPSSSAWQFHVQSPRNGSHSGRYAILQADSPRGYPNSEDYILLVRKPGELFRPAYMVHVPFDEEPPMLLDYAARPELAVMYQDFTFVWTDDGGQTVRAPPKKPKGLFDLHRFGEHWIHRVEVHAEHLYVMMGRGRDAFRRMQTETDPFAANDNRMWRFRLDGSSDAAERVGLPAFVSEPEGKEELLVVGGTKLSFRASSRDPWEEIPPEKLMDQLQQARIDFFGGTGARSLGV